MFLSFPNDHTHASSVMMDTVANNRIDSYLTLVLYLNMYICKFWGHDSLLHCTVDSKTSKRI